MRIKVLALVVLVAGCGSSAAQPSKCVVAIYFCTQRTCSRAATHAQVSGVEAQLQKRSDVYSVRFISKQAALAIMRRKHPLLVQSLPFNPFPDALRVRPVKGTSPGAIAGLVHSGHDGVEHVRYGCSR